MHRIAPTASRGCGYSIPTKDDRGSLYVASPTLQNKVQSEYVDALFTDPAACFPIDELSKPAVAEEEEAEADDDDDSASRLANDRMMQRLTAMEEMLSTVMAENARFTFCLGGVSWVVLGRPCTEARCLASGAAGLRLSYSRHQYDLCPATDGARVRIMGVLNVGVGLDDHYWAAEHKPA